MYATKMNTPLGIEILLHYHCTGGTDFPHPSPAASDCIAEYVAAGILERIPTPSTAESPNYRAVRDATTVYVEALCAVPLPVQRWIVLEKTA